MTHLAPGADGRLAVKMHGSAGNTEPFSITFDLMADQIDHFHAAMADGLCERPAGDRADVLLELRHRGSVERPMAGIMYPRRDLVDEDVAVAQHEHLHREHADIVEFLRNG